MIIITHAIVGAVKKVEEWGRYLRSTAKDAASKLWNAVVDGVKSLPEKLADIGRNIVQGLWNGINGMIQWVKDKIMGFAKNVTGWLKSFFGIQSPSKLFRDEIGKNLALGIGEGFSSEMKNVTSNMQNALPSNIDYTLNPAIAQSSMSGSVSDIDYLTAAFKKALTGMAFMVDGDKFGEMAVKNVESVVFA